MSRRLPPGAWVLIGSVGAGVMNYLYALLMTALMRPDQYSVFAGGQAVMAVTGTVANTSVPWLLAREISKAKDGSDTGLVWFATVLNGAMGLLAAAVSVAFVASFAGAGTTIWIALTTIAFFFASTGFGWAQGHGRLRLLAVLIVAEVAIKLAVGIALVALGAGPAGAFGAAFLGATIVALGMLPLMRRDLAPSRHLFLSRQLWGSVLSMGAVQAAITLLSVIDVLFATVRFGATGMSAQYQVAATLTRAPLFIALALATAAFPALSRRAGEGKLLSAHATHVLTVLLPLYIVLATLPHQVIAFVLPAQYVHAVRFLPVTAGISTLYGIVILQTTAFRAAGASAASLVPLALGLVFCLAAMIVGSGSGLMGMAVGALAGATVTVLALAWGSERTWPGAIRPSLRFLPVWALAAASLVFLHDRPWPWLVLAAIVGLATVRAALSMPDQQNLVPEPSL